MPFVPRYKSRTFYCLLESVLANGFLFYVYFSRLLYKDPFFEMNVHPFLMVTVILSMWYGNFLGLLSAGVASLYFTIAYFAAGRDFYFLFTDFQYYKFYLMFFLAAVVFGRFRDNYESRLEALKVEKKQLNEDYLQLRSIYEKTKFIKEELKKQIIGAEESILSLYEIASSLETVSSEEIYSELMGIMVRFLKAKTVSVYSLSSNNPMLRLKVRFGGVGKLPNSIDPKKITHYESVVDLKEAFKKRASDADEIPLMCAPILHNNTVLGVVNIEDMEFETITDYNFNLFKVIMDWSNKAIARAVTLEGYEDTRHKKTGFMKIEPFMERVAIEKHRMEKYGMRFSVLTYKKKKNSLEDIEKSMRSAIRDVDVLGYDAATEIIYVLLPATPPEVVPMIEERIAKVFDYTLEKAE